MLAMLFRSMWRSQAVVARRGASPGCGGGDRETMR